MSDVPIDDDGAWSQVIIHVIVLSLETLDAICTIQLSSRVISQLADSQTCHTVLY